MTGQHFRDYHLLLDEHAEQIFAMTDDIAERARKIGGTTLRSISDSDISRHQRLEDSNDESLAPKEMLAELSTDNQALTRYFRSAHETCEKYNLVEIPRRLAAWNPGLRLGPLFQCLTGVWLMYCTWAVTVNLALGYKLWI